jgi:hypothetical protein
MCFGFINRGGESKNESESKSENKRKRSMHM